jgi:metal iron transporter
MAFTKDRIERKDEIKDKHVPILAAENNTSRNHSALAPPVQQKLTSLSYCLFNRILPIPGGFTSLISPDSLMSVTYIDPGNYATGVPVAVEARFTILFIVLILDLFDIFLQSLITKLGSVMGLRLADNGNAHLPRWCTIILYILAEVAIVATDIAEYVTVTG